MKIVVYTLYQFLSFALTYDNINYISNKKNVFAIVYLFLPFWPIFYDSYRQESYCLFSQACNNVFFQEK